MDNTDWQNQFATGFKSSGGSTDYGILIWFLVLLAALAVGWYVFERLRRSRNPGTGTTAARGRYVAVPGKLNPLQQVRIQEMIDEFRKLEPSAQAIPSAILEKYSEYFHTLVPKLKTTDREVEAFVSQNFPLKNGDTIELDLHSSGTLHLVKSKVTAVGAKTILVDYQSLVPDFLSAGTTLHINYSSGKHFLQGHTHIMEVRPEVGIILSRPTHVMLASERRYSRLPLPKAAGTLQDTKSDYHSPVKVLDVSLEGVRVQVSRPLDRNHVYLLNFEAEVQGRVWPFGPLECVPSKAFLTGTGTYESGLVFLSMSIAAKQRLLNFMKLQAQELMEERKSEEAKELAERR